MVLSIESDTQWWCSRWISFFITRIVCHRIPLNVSSARFTDLPLSRADKSAICPDEKGNCCFFHEQSWNPIKSFAVGTSSATANSLATSGQHFLGWYRVRYSSILDLVGSTEIKEAGLSDGNKAVSSPAIFMETLKTGQEVDVNDGRNFYFVGRGSPETSMKLFR